MLTKVGRFEVRNQLAQIPSDPKITEMVAQIIRLPIVKIPQIIK